MRRPSSLVTRKPRLPLPTEDQVSSACLDWLRLHGWRVHRLEADRYAGHGTKAVNAEEQGTPDYIAARPGDWFYLESKRPNARRRASQIIWQADAIKRGYRVCSLHGQADPFTFMRTWMELEGL